MDTYLQLLIERKKLCHNTWILDSGASCHMAKESVWFKNISPEVMDIYLDDKNSKMISQGTGNVLAKTVSTKHCNSINLTITDVSYVPQLRSKYENLTDKRIKKIRTDNGLEFVNEQLETYLANSRIFHEKTIPYNRESNGKAERAIRVLLERARSLLYEKIENDNSIPLQTTSSPPTGTIQIPVFELNDVQNQIPVRRSERLKSKQMTVHLTNNVPNSYFEAKNSANWQNWKLAMENELDSLDKHSLGNCTNPAKSKLMKTLRGDTRVEIISKKEQNASILPLLLLRSHTAPTAGVMVWSAIAYNTRSPLVLIHDTMTAQRYVHDILQPHVLPFMQRVPGAIFRKENVRPRTARVSQDCLGTVTTLPGPARSPDFSPIELIWDHLG
ncbi:retrovirus-related Pol polyprotein from transposon TNT 1-94 [Trichonephila clavipes]|nr:retrovirus-related Pol polyprotein from transposon TNT 1-94 [Trichonephila clavipes]